MGLLWSLQAAGPPPSVADPAQEEQVSVTVTGGGPPEHASLSRSMAGSGVNESQLRPGPGQPLYGDYFGPAGAGSHPGMVLVGGAEGGLDTGVPVAEALAARGVAVLDLAYFAEPGLPSRLEDIPIEYFAAAARWLGHQKGVDPGRIYLYGVSRGTEAVLLTASYFPGLVAGVVALDPTDSAFCGDPDCSKSGWSYQGRPVPFTHQVSNPRPTDVPSALIPIGRYGGRVLLVCGGADSRWASCPYSRAIASELRARGQPDPELLDFPQAGHGVGFALPYLPELDGPGLAGSSPAANPEARASEWPRILAFLRAK
jgi:dienelactone hydrolase